MPFVSHGDNSRTGIKYVQASVPHEKLENTVQHKAQLLPIRRKTPAIDLHPNTVYIFSRQFVCQVCGPISLGAVSFCASPEDHECDLGWVRNDSIPPRECLTDSVVLHITGTRSIGDSYQTVAGLFFCVGMGVACSALQSDVKNVYMG